MKVIRAAALALIAGGAAAAAKAPGFPEVVRAIQIADYKGERADLRRLAAALERDDDPKLAAYRHYWRGFALWRRAVNGFNEAPLPEDLEADLKAGLASFEKALALHPDWIEAHIGIMGCAGPLLFLAKDDPTRRVAVLQAYLPVARDVAEKGHGNPRALWLQGQALLGAPPPTGGQPEKAAATFQRGIEAAIAEARRAPADEPVWIPVWGGAENLMNLAYLHTHSALKNRDLALAYARGALVAAPDWHYVRDILWPKILELALPSVPEAAKP
jgi:hypothetical protein